MSKIPSANENFPPSITVYDLFRIPSYKYTTNEHAKQWFCVYETKFSSDAYFDMTTITWLLLIFSLVGGFFFLSFSLVFGHISKILNIDALAKMLLHLCVPSAFFFCNNFFCFVLKFWNVEIAVFGCDLADCYYSRALHKCVATKKMFNALCERSKINQLQNAGMYSTHFFWCALKCASQHTLLNRMPALMYTHIIMRMQSLTYSLTHSFLHTRKVTHL